MSEERTQTHCGHLCDTCEHFGQWSLLEEINATVVVELPHPVRTTSPDCVCVVFCHEAQTGTTALPLNVCSFSRRQQRQLKSALILHHHHMRRMEEAHWRAPALKQQRLRHDCPPLRVAPWCQWCQWQWQWWWRRLANGDADQDAVPAGAATQERWSNGARARWTESGQQIGTNRKVAKYCESRARWTHTHTHCSAGSIELFIELPSDAPRRTRNVLTLQPTSCPFSGTPHHPQCRSVDGEWVRAQRRPCPPLLPHPLLLTVTRKCLGNPLLSGLYSPSVRFRECHACAGNSSTLKCCIGCSGECLWERERLNAWPVAPTDAVPIHRLRWLSLAPLCCSDCFPSGPRLDTASSWPDDPPPTADDPD